MGEGGRLPAAGEHPLISGTPENGGAHTAADHAHSRAAVRRVPDMAGGSLLRWPSPRPSAMACSTTPSPLPRVHGRRPARHARADRRGAHLVHPDRRAVRAAGRSPAGRPRRARPDDRRVAAGHRGGAGLVAGGEPAAAVRGVRARRRRLLPAAVRGGVRGHRLPLRRQRARPGERAAGPDHRGRVRLLDLPAADRPAGGPVRLAYGTSDPGLDLRPGGDPAARLRAAPRPYSEEAGVGRGAGAGRHRQGGHPRSAVLVAGDRLHRQRRRGRHRGGPAHHLPDPPGPSAGAGRHVGRAAGRAVCRPGG